MFVCVRVCVCAYARVCLCACSAPPSASKMTWLTCQAEMLARGLCSLARAGLLLDACMQVRGGLRVLDHVAPSLYHCPPPLSLLCFPL